LIERIGAALAVEPGQILIVGHSDNVPVIAARSFDNVELSRRRAQLVAERMAPTIGGEQRMSVEGRGDTQAIASNDTPTGRQRNRRVEVLLSREGRIP
jgi:type VI secretion system protein ImpK